MIDGSGSMARKIGQTTSSDQALAWARQFIARLSPGDSVAVLVAKDRVLPLVAPASFDMKKVEDALLHMPRAHGASDLAMALTECTTAAGNWRQSGPRRDYYSFGRSTLVVAA